MRDNVEFVYRNNEFALINNGRNLAIAVRNDLVPNLSEIDEFYHQLKEVSDSELLTTYLKRMEASSRKPIFGGKNADLDGFCSFFGFDTRSHRGSIPILKRALTVLNFLYDYWKVNEFLRYDSDYFVFDCEDYHCLKLHKYFDEVPVRSLFIDGFVLEMDDELNSNDKSNLTYVFADFFALGTSNVTIDKDELYHVYSEGVFCASDRKGEICKGAHAFAGNSNVDFRNVNSKGFHLCNIFNSDGFYVDYTRESYVGYGHDFSQFDVEKLSYSIGDGQKMLAVSTLDFMEIRDLFFCYDFFDSDESFRRWWSNNNESVGSNLRNFPLYDLNKDLIESGNLTDETYQIIEACLNEMREVRKVIVYNYSLLLGLAAQAVVSGKQRFLLELANFCERANNTYKNLVLDEHRTSALMYAFSNEEITFRVAFDLEGARPLD